MSNEDNTISVDKDTWNNLWDERDRFMIALQEIARMSCVESLIPVANIAKKALNNQ